MVQNWALKYWLGMIRRDLIRDEEDKLKEQYYIINHPDSWRKVVLDPETANIGPDGQPELPITDPRQLDHWFESLAGQKGMTGAQAEAMFAGAPAHLLLGHADGPGRKV